MFLSQFTERLMHLGKTNLIKATTVVGEVYAMKKTPKECLNDGADLSFLFKHNGGTV